MADRAVQAVADAWFDLDHAERTFVGERVSASLANALDRMMFGDPGQADMGLIKATIAHHAAAALNLAVTPDGVMMAFGDRDWARGRWHLHVADALRQLADQDPAAAAAFIRERALAGLAGPGKAA